MIQNQQNDVKGSCKGVFTVPFIMMLMLISLLITLMSCDKKASAVSAPRYMKTIRKARKKIRPFKKDVLPLVNKYYKKYVRHSSWRVGAKRCRKLYSKQFKLLAEKTGYPVAYIAGIALHESAGCKMRVSDRAGGQCLMQITGKKEYIYRRNAARMLGINIKKLDYKRNVVHCITMGLVIHDAYEKQFKSRPHGLLAYNRGPGNVRKDIKRMGYSVKRPPSLNKMHPHLPRSKWIKPHIYGFKVLACVAMMKRVFAGKPLRQAPAVTAKDIPGFYPSDDGVWPVTIN